MREKQKYRNVIWARTYNSVSQLSPFHLWMKGGKKTDGSFVRLVFPTSEQTKICANILVGNLLHYVISGYRRNELSTVYEPVSQHFIKYVYRRHLIQGLPSVQQVTDNILTRNSWVRLVERSGKHKNVTVLFAVPLAPLSKRRLKTEKPNMVLTHLPTFTVHIHTHIHGIYIHTFTHIWPTYTHTYIHTYIHTHTHTHAGPTYTHTYIRTYVNTCMHTYTNTQTHTLFFNPARFNDHTISILHIQICSIQRYGTGNKMDHSSIHSVVCLTTGPKALPKRPLHIVRSKASSFKWEYRLLSLRSPSSFLRLLPRLPVTSIPPFFFPSITRCRRHFLRKTWAILSTFRLPISCRIFLCSSTLK